MPKTNKSIQSTPAKATTKLAKPTLTEKLAQLEQQVEWFYSEEFSLDQASAQYEAAIELANDVEKDLKSLKNHIEILDKDFTKA